VLRLSITVNNKIYPQFIPSKKQSRLELE